MAGTRSPDERNHDTRIIFLTRTDESAESRRTTVPDSSAAPRDDQNLKTDKRSPDHNDCSTLGQTQILCPRLRGSNAAITFGASLYMIFPA